MCISYFAFRSNQWVQICRRKIYVESYQYIWITITTCVEDFWAAEFTDGTRMLFNFSNQLNFSKQAAQKLFTIKLKEAQAIKHQEYLTFESKINTNKEHKIAKNNCHQSFNRKILNSKIIGRQECKNLTSHSKAWKNVVLTMEDFMLSNFNERTLIKRFKTKVISFRGSTISDLNDYINLFQRKNRQHTLDL